VNQKLLGTLKYYRKASQVLPSTTTNSLFPLAATWAKWVPSGLKQNERARSSDRGQLPREQGSSFPSTIKIL